MSVGTSAEPRTAAAARPARALLIAFCCAALLALVVPPVFPPYLPTVHRPLWVVLAVLSAGLALWLTVRPAPPRPVTLTLGWSLVVLALAQAFGVGDLIAMFGTWLVVPALALLAGRVRPRTRKALVAAHVIAAACWVGVAVAISAMAFVALTAADIETSRVAYELMAAFDITLLPWCNFATFLTGLALGITTPWGVIRYYWLAAKLVIAVAILVMAFGFLHNALETAAAQAAVLADAGGTPADLTAAADVALWGFAASAVSLIGAVLLSLYKPGGTTRWGRKSVTGKRVRQSAHAAVVTATRMVADGTVDLTLRAADDDGLPPWEPGAHIDVVLPSGRVRQFSLHGDPADTGCYRIAVLKEPRGRGGSLEIHQLRVGDRVGIRGPRNNFPLVDAPSYLFVAGGIGITPFLPMIRRLQARGADWRLVYRGRSLATMAFAQELRHRYPERVTLLPADTRARPDIAALLRDAAPGVAVYCCGPTELLDTVTATMAAACPHGSLHLERFAASARDGVENTAFDAELRRTGVVVRVPEDRTLLSVLRDVDPAVDLSCEDGVCGSCVTRVLAGRPDHRDDVLGPGERQRADIIYPCVSLAHGQRIVLDI
ncbi:PDR/VanB family oxidoreductase [Nocardia otitidiscaviarum]|uniref:PDR/VanB family oxidoreductase n=1 Tax=Nocardia otitidiscaviarum TaxID=1823 RepID=UPI0024588390|nr:PDR/VanB family oxidoreductase [Nocardia otitidiscaviarum]